MLWVLFSQCAYFSRIKLFTLRFRLAPCTPALTFKLLRLIIAFFVHPFNRAARRLGYATPFLYGKNGLHLLGMLLDRLLLLAEHHSPDGHRCNTCTPHSMLWPFPPFSFYLESA